MDKLKYIILDFGKVLFKPTTGHWFITPKFLSLIDISCKDIDRFNNNVSLYNNILSRKIVTLEEEYDMFYEFYSKMLDSINLNISDNIIKEIAFDITYNDTKYTIYEDTIDSLKFLSSKYKLLLLTDNWPCVHNILIKNNIDKYFDKVYVSSEYGCMKKDKVFFDYPINDYNIKYGQALFIDDTLELIDVAHTCGLDVKLMDREYLNPKIEYDVIHDLKVLCKKNNES